MDFGRKREGSDFVQFVSLAFFFFFYDNAVFKIMEKKKKNTTSSRKNIPLSFVMGNILECCVSWFLML